jgi:hypothetical protein
MEDSRDGDWHRTRIPTMEGRGLRLAHDQGMFV